MDKSVIEADLLVGNDRTLYPDFLTLPEPSKTIYDILAFEDKFVVGDLKQIFDLPSEAYDYIQEELQGTPRFTGKDLNSAGENMGGMFFEKGTNRLLISFTADDNYRLLKSQYREFLKLNKRYQANKKDWVLAYQWVENHPAFYHKYPNDSEHWVIDQGWASCWQSVSRHKGQPYVLLEHGSWLDQTDDEGNIVNIKTVASHDIDLDTSAKTYEKAVIKFAKRVNKNYDERGERRIPFGE